MRSNDNNINLLRIFTGITAYSKSKSGVHKKQTATIFVAITNKSVLVILITRQSLTKFVEH